MAFFRFLVVCLVVIYLSCTAAEDDSVNKDIKATSRFADIRKQCLEGKVINARNNKILCLICTGFDPSCLGSKTNSTSTTEIPTNTTETSTTTSETSITTTETSITTTEIPNTEAPANE